MRPTAASQQRYHNSDGGSSSLIAGNCGRYASAVLSVSQAHARTCTTLSNNGRRSLISLGATAPASVLIVREPPSEMRHTDSKQSAAQQQSPLPRIQQRQRQFPAGSH